MTFETYSEPLSTATPIEKTEYKVIFVGAGYETIVNNDLARHTDRGYTIHSVNPSGKTDSSMWLIVMERKTLEQ